MDIVAHILDLNPIFTASHELQRATFHLAGVATPFIAFGRAAQQALDAYHERHPMHVLAGSRVRLNSCENAFLVDTAQ